ncbi:MAG: RNase A-like domain-containing protein, partial [Bryobacteraceae bacterium]
VFAAGGGYGESSASKDPSDIEEPVESELPAPTPDPISADKPTPVSDREVGPNNQSQGISRRLIAGGLLRHELAGGHSLEEHMGLDDGDLFNRLNQNLNLRETSTFTEIETAHAAISSVIEANQARIEAARVSGEAQIVLKGQYGEITGRWLARGAQAPINVSGVTVVLRPDPKTPWGFRIVTAYPGP